MSVQRFSRGERRWRRALAIVSAVVAAEALWVVADLVFGVRLQAPAGNGYPQPVDVGPGAVALASAVLSLVGWGLLALLERVTKHARRVWLGLASLASVLSFSLPLSGTGVAPTDRAVLVLMHLIVAAIVMPVLYRTSPQTERAARQPTPLAMREAA